MRLIKITIKNQIIMKKFLIRLNLKHVKYKFKNKPNLT